MPRMVFDTMNFGDLFDYPFCQSHSNGSSPKIYKRVNEVLVIFKHKTTLVDFLVLESKAQGNIVLGRSFLRSVGAIIDVKKGCIRSRFPIKGRFSFPLKQKEVLIEGKVAMDLEKT